jgi:hypothetical protein
LFGLVPAEPDPRGCPGWSGRPADVGFCFGPPVTGLTGEPVRDAFGLSGAAAASAGSLPDSGAVGSLASLAIRLSSIVTMGSRSACAFS